MAITVGNISSSGDAGSPNTDYGWLHTCAPGTTCLIVIARSVDSSSSDANVTGVSFGATAFTGELFDSWNNDMGCSFWYLENPTTETELTITVTHNGKVTDAAGCAIDLAGVDLADLLDVTRSYGASGSSISVSALATAGNTLMIGSPVCTADDDAATTPNGETGIGLTQIDSVDMGQTSTTAAYMWCTASGNHSYGAVCTKSGTWNEFAITVNMLAENPDEQFAAIQGIIPEPMPPPLSIPIAYR